MVSIYNQSTQIRKHYLLFVTVFETFFGMVIGFDHSIMVCCGTGGPPLNYDDQVGCGKTASSNGTIKTAKPCYDSSKYVNWDGIHYTEAANRYVALHILTGKYSETASSLNL